jgi:putative endonuclease
VKTDARTAKRRLGDIGENIAAEFLRRRGFEILETNYLRKWGEIDIVARREGALRFVEVKSVSGGTTQFKGRVAVPPETGEFRPEDNMRPAKIQRLLRTMQSYMLEKRADCDFQLDLVTVRIDMGTRQARVEMIENIVI